MELAQLSLVNSTINYNSLAATLEIVKKLLSNTTLNELNAQGVINPNNPGVDILKKIFHSLNPSWYYWQTGATYFDQQYIYYNTIDSRSKAIWLPENTSDLTDALNIVGLSYPNNFLTMSIHFAKYLGFIWQTTPTLFDVLVVLNGLIYIVIQRIELENLLRYPVIARTEF